MTLGNRDLGRFCRAGGSPAHGTLHTHRRDTCPTFYNVRRVKLEAALALVKK
jgi:hypothetical protein